MDEVRLENRLKKEIERRGGKAPKFVSPGRRGVQDRIVLMPRGRVWFVELKAPGRKATPLQEYRADELRSLGFKVRTVSTVSELQAFLEEVDADAV